MDDESETECGHEGKPCDECGDCPRCCHCDDYELFEEEFDRSEWADFLPPMDLP